MIYNDPQQYAMTCELFDDCNLRCAFCYKNCSNKVNNASLQYIKEQLPNDLEKLVLPELIRRDVHTLIVSLYGGELFYDDIPDEYFEAYEQLFWDWKSRVLSKLENCKVMSCFVSNGVYTKRERVAKILEHLNAVMNISYDPTGRFAMAEQEQLCYDSINYFNKLGRLAMVTVTLTRPSIQKIMKEDIFAKFSKDILLDISYYSPSNNDNYALMPSDDEVWEFYKFCIDKGYNVSETNNLCLVIKRPELKIPTYCECKYSTGTALVNGKTICSPAHFDLINDTYEGGVEEFFGENYEALLKDKSANKCEVGKAKRGCYTCEYEQLCPAMCYTTILWHGTKLTECPLKKGIEYLKEHPEKMEYLYKNIKGVN